MKTNFFQVDLPHICKEMFNNTEPELSPKTNTKEQKGIEISFTIFYNSEQCEKLVQIMFC